MLWHRAAVACHLAPDSVGLVGLVSPVALLHRMLENVARIMAPLMAVATSLEH